MTDLNSLKVLAVQFKTGLFLGSFKGVLKKW